MDLTDFLPENATQRLIAEQFLILKLPEAVWQYVRAVFDAAFPFFQETLDVKSACSFPEDMGYRPFGVEYSQSPSYPDQVESFSVSVRAPITGSNLRSGNAQVLYERMLTIFDVFERTAEALAMALATKLGNQQIGKNLIGALHLWSRLQLNYSRPAEIALPFINESHEDGNLLTVTCASGPGLEVELAKNEFRRITTSPGEVLILPGDIASLLSGGQIRPLFHRVRADPEVRERMALLFFGDVDPSRCEPWVPNELNRNVDIGARVLASVTRFGLKGFAAK